MELYSGQWIFKNKLQIYPDLGYWRWPHHDITSQCSAYQLVCNSMEAHDLTSPVAGAVGSRCIKIRFMLLLNFPS